MSRPRKKNKRHSLDDGSLPDIHWASSDARKVLLEDLELKHLPLYDFQLDAASAWEVYKAQPEFEKVPFKQFERQLGKHREQVLKRQAVIQTEEEAMRQFRARNPRQTTNNQGDPVIDLMPVKDLIREDVEKERHVGLTPSQFQQTRVEYQALRPVKFKERLYQEIRRKKHIFDMNEKSKEQREKATARHEQNEQAFQQLNDQGVNFAHI